MFKISCKEIRSTLAKKHSDIANDEIELIAKSAKKQSNTLIELFEKMDMKICSQPKDIEELTSIRDYMANVPNEIEKLSGDIRVCMGIYEILNQFCYKFKEDEDYDKKWKVHGAPKETISKIEI